ncbi:MAG: hypothetical protein GOU98_02065 [Candidatus Altiarchaeota archaeon]|nr:hypothetical protein [Candidatus Altiarchaeota archaeon]
MRGISLLVYTILFTFIFFIDQSAFLSMAGAMRGVPAQIDFLVTKIAEDIVYSDTVSMPQDMEVFVSECFFPTHEHLSQEGHEAAISSCENSIGVVCLFYNYFGYMYSACQGILFTPTETLYDLGRDPGIYTVVRDLEERTFTLTKAGV